MKLKHYKPTSALRRLHHQVQSLELHLRILTMQNAEKQAVIERIDRAMNMNIAKEIAVEDMLQEIFDAAGIEMDVERRVLEAVVEWQAEEDACDAIYKAKTNSQTQGANHVAA